MNSAAEAYCTLPPTFPPSVPLILLSQQHLKYITDLCVCWLNSSLFHETPLGKLICGLTTICSSSVALNFDLNHLNFLTFFPKSVNISWSPEVNSFQGCSSWFYPNDTIKLNQCLPGRQRFSNLDVRTSDWSRGLWPWLRPWLTLSEHHFSHLWNRCG